MNSPQPPAHIDELLDRVFGAISRGDRETPNRFAGQVLAIDHDHADAEDLLTAPADQGEIRRLSIMFVDLVDSTALSTRVLIFSTPALLMIGPMSPERIRGPAAIVTVGTKILAPAALRLLEKAA